MIRGSSHETSMLNISCDYFIALEEPRKIPSASRFPAHSVSRRRMPTRARAIAQLRGTRNMNTTKENVARRGSCELLPAHFAQAYIRNMLLHVYFC